MTLFRCLKSASVSSYSLSSNSGFKVEILDWGASINSVLLDFANSVTEVAVGFTDADTRGDDYFGSIVGRFANRIKGGEFKVSGKTYRALTNEGSNTLHGGPEGFSSRIWNVDNVSDNAIELSLISPDGDQGFPGELTTKARYQVFGTTLSLDLSATTTAPTVCSLTNHAYWNLAGGGTVDDHFLTVDADQFVPIDDESIPLGELRDVDGTPFDLRSSRRIGEVVRSRHEQIEVVHGLDHSFQIRGDGFRRCARLEYPKTGRALEVWSDIPGVQIYTGNSFDGSLISRNGRLRQGDAIAIEPQYHPDAVNQPWSSGVFLDPGEEWKARIEWRFSENK